MVKQRLFDSLALQKIEAAIKEAESKTSGEIVVLVVGASDSYSWVTPLLGLLGFVFSNFFLAFYVKSADWSISLGQVLSIQWASVMFAIILSRIPWFRRKLIPESLKENAVHRECLAQFMALGLTDTKDRTGVLIYLSELEHRVEILADKAIHAIVGGGYWNEQITQIVRGIHDEKATEAICGAIQTIGNKLQTYFPRKSDDTNELDDSVR